jgi:glycosyltransferase involved in cell wall biosynthesis
MIDPATRRLRILEIETFGRGGLIHYAFNLSCALAERGHDVTLMTTGAYELAHREAPDSLGVLTDIAPLTSRGMPLPGPVLGPATKVEAVVDAFRVADAARRLAPDVIHFHSTNSSAAAFLTRLRHLGIPLVATAHNVTSHEQNRWHDAAFRRAYGICDLVIAHSEVDRERLVGECGLDRARIAVIPHGEYGFFERPESRPDRRSARQRLGLGDDDEVALFFGYIREYKGLDVLLDGWPQVTEARPSARLVIAGDTGRLGRHDHIELERRASELGAVHRFEYIPFEDVGSYFAAADLVALPYRRLSQSGIVYLALALGVPVVATTVGGLPELLDDEVSALLVAPDDSHALAGAIIRLLAEPELRTTLAAGGRRIADSHSWPKIAETTAVAFGRLAGNGS